MEVASPEVEFLGFCVLLLALAGGLAASVLFLRDKGAGPWVMLTGSISLLLSMVPRGLEQLVNYYAQKGYEPPSVSGVMYYAIWDWLPTASAVLFAVGLLLTAIQRKGLSRRIAELESILSAHDTDLKR